MQPVDYVSIVPFQTGKFQGQKRQTLKDIVVVTNVRYYDNTPNIYYQPTLYQNIFVSSIIVITVPFEIVLITHPANSRVKTI